MEKKDLEITIKDLEAHIVFLKKEQKQEAEKLKKMVAKTDEFNAWIKNETSKIDERKDQLLKERYEFEEERDAFIKQKPDIQAVIDMLNQEMLDKCEELDKLDERTSKTARSESKIRQTISLLKATKDRLTSSKKQAEKEYKEAEQKLKKMKKALESELSKLAQATFHKNEELDKFNRTNNELRKIQEEKEEVAYDLKKIKEEYRTYLDILTVKRRNVNIIVDRLEKKYKEAYPNLRLPL